MRKRTLIVGGGAAGLIAAITAAQNGDKVTVLERNERVGKKLLATGNGRCNFTNINAGLGHYYGRDTGFAAQALEQFGPRRTMDFFYKLGLVSTVEEEGRVYPLCGQASAVLDVLRFSLAKAGVETLTSFDVSDAGFMKNDFIISAKDGRSARGDKLIIASGGRAATPLSSNGSGYDLLSGFGHTVTKTFPALVQLKTDGALVKPLKGLRVQAGITLRDKKNILAQEQGEILFTDYGLSGIPVLSVSRVVEDRADITAKLDLTPEFERDQLLVILQERANVLAGSGIDVYFTGFFSKMLGQAILKRAGVSNMPVSGLEDGQIQKLADTIKRFELKITGTRGFADAQVTSGGAATAEFFPETMQSRMIPGLYAAGEVLDIHGDCGGYNLQWSWSSGYLAGCAI